ncbi:PAS domain-containing protein [Halovenus salina]|uniref:PAS domain-containing protein n=2 Tax=Halovenus salina TaxID=1510225 RepID=A0ABD5VVX3_9EURY
MQDQPGELAVLHVDDNPQFVGLSETLLESESEQLRVETATNPETVLREIDTWEYDCVVSDYDMPEMDGIAFLEAVRSEYPDLPVIVFTGKGSEEVAAEALSAGATDYIQKRGETSQFTVLANRIENAVEQYRARQEAERADRRRQRTLERITDGFVEFDEELVITNLNEQAESLLGVTREEMVGTQYDEFVSGNQSDSFDAYRAVLDSQESKTIVQKGDINPGRWYKERIFPAEGDDGIFVYFRDITERKEQKRVLKEKTHQLEAVLDNVQSAIWMRDNESRFRLMNQNYREMFGIEDETEVAEKTPEDLFDDELAEQFRAYDREALAAEESLEFKENIETDDGTRTFLTRLTP